jgi:hypothetical protein
MDAKSELRNVRKTIKTLSIKADLSDDEAKQLQDLMAKAVKLETQVEAQAEADKEDAEAKAEAEKEEKEKVDAAVKAAKAEWEKEAAKSRRLPYHDAPYQAQFSEAWKYDALSAADLALMTEVLRSSNRPVPAVAYKALAFKIAELKDDNTVEGHADLAYIKSAFKAGTGIEPTVDAIKAVTDPMYTGGTTDGGNWALTAYSTELWKNIRAGSNIVSKIPSVVIPDGWKSYTYPIEGTDPTWYVVAEATTAGTNVPSNTTITASQVTTPTKVELTVAKMGAKVMYTGEMAEDSLIPFVAQLREQLAVSGAEMMEHVVIDGDTSADATNINETITGSAGTEIWCLLNGFRHLALITNSANSRAGGSLTEEDYLETMWLMGTAGLAGADLAKCAFIVDPNVYKKSLQLASIKTQDVWANATLESGVLTKLWGYNIYPSWNMHRANASRKCTSVGDIDDITSGNNAYGAILGVRWDQWKLGYKRQMTMETTRYANSDSWEIVALTRWGLMYRDTEAASITYGLTV